MKTSCDDSNQLPPGDLEFSMAAIDKKILVLSGKGGVGKSTAAVNIAVELSRRGLNVGLLDIDLHGPSVPRMTDTSDVHCSTIKDKIVPIQAGNLKIMSIAYLLQDEKQAVIWRGPMKHTVIKQLLGNTDWGILDYLIVDFPPGTGDEPLAAAELIGDGAEAVVVTTPQQVAVGDVRRCITFCEKLSLTVRGIVENMSSAVCPACGEVFNIYGSEGGRKLAEETGIELLGSIPIDPKITAGADEGRPISESGADEATLKALACIIDKLLKDTNKTTKGNDNMRIAIPLADGKLTLHFGHCRQFAVMDVDPENKSITAREDMVPPEHEPGVLPKWLHGMGVTHIIAAGMGQRAQQLFNQNGIEVIVGAEADTPENLVKAFLSESLVTGQNICDH
ncbi:Cell division inhibitor MinD [Limihaloglobus sulfuriphilus]|uniref:Iron-sulfur cluster carrier protein n=1 Tax=Limihaloglobus sulfuriphilus TaxID=1851148 RepID=A0A1Q2MCC6_9BACT|nr:iron-sulfur cluster carrier protein MrpORP [Limihaloglobus sulfuriphilus]AQQ70314.1 Cell division inhibitor MinD [Limihaloglobus sulfuriphilus]